MLDCNMFQIAYCTVLCIALFRYRCPWKCSWMSHVMLGLWGKRRKKKTHHTCTWQVAENDSGHGPIMVKSRLDIPDHKLRLGGSTCLYSDVFLLNQPESLVWYLCWLMPWLPMIPD